jgi:hypothetical protein
MTDQERVNDAEKIFDKELVLHADYKSNHVHHFQGMKWKNRLHLIWLIFFGKECVIRDVHTTIEMKMAKGDEKPTAITSRTIW